MKFHHITFSILLVLTNSCTEHKQPAPANDSPTQPTTPSTATTPVVEARTFEVKDSLGKASGWGYDLYVDGKRTIHQPTIPAIAGIHAFRTETDAQRVGELAAAKIRAGLGLPTISTQELDSMQIRP